MNPLAVDYTHCKRRNGMMDAGKTNTLKGKEGYHERIKKKAMGKASDAPGCCECRHGVVNP
jgi:hypothetical protein